MSSLSRGARPPLPPKFPFDHDELVKLLLRDCRGIRMITGSHDVLHAILQWGVMYLRSTQCSVNKALEKVCSSICITFGASVHPRFWRAVKGLCHHDGGRRYQQQQREVHPYAPCMMRDVVVTDRPSNGVITAGGEQQTIWAVPSEAWIRSPRPWIDIKDEHEDQRRSMNFNIVEAIVHHQMEHTRLWKSCMDFYPIFMALTLARRGDDQKFTAEMASYYATIAIRYEADESRCGSAAFKGLRRWRNVCPEKVTELTLKCLWGHKETPRHHQLWHLHRIVNNEVRVRDTPSAAIMESVFLLLVAVASDHVFASIPPEDAAECVVNALFSKHQLTSKQHFDLSRIHYALRQPRSPYLSILFPIESQIPVEAWDHKLSVPTPPSGPPVAEAAPSAAGKLQRRLRT